MVTVLKTFFLAKLNYIGQMLDEFMKKMNECIFKFLWKGKQDRIKRSQMIQEYKFGGVKSLMWTHPKGTENKLDKADICIIHDR